jgi:hypothetical protein
LALSGAIIPDNSTVKAALQALETAAEAEALWDRSSTTLSPHTANDSVSIGTGNFITAGGNSTWVVLPAAGGAGIQTAITAANTAGGGIIQLLAGTYAFSTAIVWPVNVANNVRLIGVGPETILASSVPVCRTTKHALDLVNDPDSNADAK